MLGDELNQKLYAVTVQSTETGMKLLTSAIKSFLDRDTKKAHGKQTLKDLNKQNAELQNIPISEKDVKNFEKELRKFGVDYAVKKDVTQANSYVVYFKARDITQIDDALKSYTTKQFSRENRPSIKERINRAVEKASQQTFKRDKTKDRGAR